MGESGRLLERDHELARGRELVGRLARGEPDAIIVEGAAGVGKSTLLQAIAKSASDEGVRVLAATGSLLEAAVPYAVVHQLFARPMAMLPAGSRGTLLSGAASLAASLVTNAAPVATPDPQALLHGLYWLTVGWSGSGPLLISVDDAQWSDESSLQFLGYLLRRIEALPVGVLLGIREGEPSLAASALESLRREPMPEAIRLRELSAEGTAAKVAALAGQTASGTFTDACHAMTHGNPFLIEELVATCAGDRIPFDEGGAERLSNIAVPQVADAVLLRLGSHGREAVEVARAVAVLGSSATVRRAAALAGMTTEVAVSAVETLTRAQLFAADPPLRLRHPLVQSAVYDDLPGASRATRHAHAAELLLEEHADAEVIAPHLLRTEPAGSLRWQQVLNDAGRRAMERGAFEAAATLLRRALAEAPAVPAAEIRRDLGAALATFDAPSAIEELRAALALTADPGARAEAALTYAEVVLLAGDPVGAATALDDALDGLPDTAEPVLRGRVLAQWGHAAIMAGRSRDEVYDRLEPHVVADPSPGVLPLAVAALAAPTPSERFEWARRAAADPRGLALVGPASSVLPSLVFQLCVDGAVEIAGEIADGMVRAAATSGSTLATAAASYCRGLAGFMAGRLADAEADAETAVELAGTGGWAGGRTPSIALLARVRCERDRIDDALSTVGLLGGEKPQVVAADIALVLVAAREYAEALAVTEMLDALVGPLGGLAYLAPHVLALAGVGRIDDARATADRALEAARARLVPLGVADILLARAAVVETDQAVTAWQQAVDELTVGPYRLHAAKALAGLGGALRRDRQPANGRHVLEQALDAASRCGAVALAGRIRDELAATGARPRRTAVTGVAALTAAELRAARLAADGMSNDEVAQALFVSVKTVETQLTAAYRKLAIRGRSQLAAALADD